MCIYILYFFKLQIMGNNLLRLLDLLENCTFLRLLISQSSKTIQSVLSEWIVIYAPFSNSNFQFIIFFFFRKKEQANLN
jgi:hypothetical protein